MGNIDIEREKKKICENFQFILSYATAIRKSQQPVPHEQRLPGGGRQQQEGQTVPHPQGVRRTRLAPVSGNWCL